MAENPKGIPKEIWLQVGDDCDCADFAALLKKHGTDVTWCADKIDASDIGPFVYAPRSKKKTEG